MSIGKEWLKQIAVGRWNAIKTKTKEYNKTNKYNAYNRSIVQGETVYRCNVIIIFCLFSVSKSLKKKSES